MNTDPAHRSHRAPKLISLRELTADDLPRLLQKPVRHRLRAIRDSHHNIARRIAAGQSHRQIANDVGMPIARITTLLADPSFIELVNHYRAEVTAVWRDHVDALAELAVANLRKSERQIADALDAADEPDAAPIPLPILARISADRMDRFGYGKHTTSTNINVGFAAKLEAAISRSRKVAAE